MAMIKFLDQTGAITVALAQGGDYIGGVDNGNFKKKLLRKAMNSFFCRTYYSGLFRSWWQVRFLWRIQQRSH